MVLMAMVHVVVEVDRGCVGWGFWYGFYDVG